MSKRFFISSEILDIEKYPILNKTTFNEREFLNQAKKRYLQKMKKTGKDWTSESQSEFIFNELLKNRRGRHYAQITRLKNIEGLNVLGTIFSIADNEYLQKLKNRFTFQNEADEQICFLKEIPDDHDVNIEDTPPDLLLLYREEVEKNSKLKIKLNDLTREFAETPLTIDEPSPVEDKKYEFYKKGFNIFYEMFETFLDEKIQKDVKGEIKQYNITPKFWNDVVGKSGIDKFLSENEWFFEEES